MVDFRPAIPGSFSAVVDTGLVRVDARRLPMSCGISAGSATGCRPRIRSLIGGPIFALALVAAFSVRFATCRAAHGPAGEASRLCLELDIERGSSRYADLPHRESRQSPKRQGVGWISVSRTADAYPPISSYALIGDSHSSGLVSREGSVDWACFRRLDAPSTFARILDWMGGGYCSLSPVGAEPAGRAYTRGTTILESEHKTGDARGRTIDFFAISGVSRVGEAARVHPHHQLIRIAEGVTGTTEWEFVCRPCFEYGIVRPRVTLAGERLGMLVGGPEALTVASSVPLRAEDGAAHATFRLRQGGRAWFALTGHRPEDVRIEAFG